jgi:hypothetical protein
MLEVLKLGTEVLKLGREVSQPAAEDLQSGKKSVITVRSLSKQHPTLYSCP